MSVEDWSRTEGDNDLLAKDGFPFTGTSSDDMDRSDTNDQERAVLAAFRTLVQEAQWFDRLQANKDNYTVSQFLTTVFLVTDVVGGGTDAREHFSIGSMVKLSGTGGPVYAWVSSLGYGAPPNVVVGITGAVDASYVAANCPNPLTKVECFAFDRVREVAMRPVGATLAQTPKWIASIDDLGSAALATKGAAGGCDADTLDGQHGDEFERATYLPSYDYLVAEMTNVGTAKVGVTGMVGIDYPGPAAADGTHKFVLTAAVCVTTAAVSVITVRLHAGPLGTINDPAIYTVDPGVAGIAAAHIQFRLGPVNRVPVAGEKLSVSIEIPADANADVIADGTTPGSVGDHEVDTQNQSAETFLRIEETAA